MSVISFSYFLPTANVTINTEVTQLPCASAATHRGVFVTPVTPDSQSAALGCAAVINIQFCVFCAKLLVCGWETEAQGSRFIVPVVGSGSSDRGPGGLWSLQSSVCCCSIPSLPCHIADISCSPQHPWHELSTHASSASCPQEEIRLILSFAYGSYFPTRFGFWFFFLQRK